MKMWQYIAGGLGILVVGAFVGYMIAQKKMMAKMEAAGLKYENGKFLLMQKNTVGYANGYSTPALPPANGTTSAPAPGQTPSSTTTIQPAPTASEAKI